MDIELLRTFLEVTQVRHFGRAAENLYLTPAAVSARIRQLEQMLGVTLLFRTRGNIQMTPDGERLLPHARKLLVAWTETLDDLSLKLEPQNKLRIGAIASLWHCHLPQLNDALIQSTHQLTLESHSHLELVTQILNQQLDAALLLDLSQHPELSTVKVVDVELALFTSAPIINVDNPQQEAPEPYIYIAWSGAFAAFHNKRTAPDEPLLSTNDAFAASNLMQQFSSSAYLPASTVREGFRRVARAPHFMQPIYLIYKTGQEHADNLRQFMAKLQL